MIDDLDEPKHEGMMQCDFCRYFNIITLRDHDSKCHKCGRHL